MRKLERGNESREGGGVKEGEKRESTSKGEIKRIVKSSRRRLGDSINKRKKERERERERERRRGGGGGGGKG